MADLIRVVVVDDVAEVRRMLRTALRFGGGGRLAVVGDADTAGEAVAVAERLQPQVVVLDLGLPDISGHQLVARIREAAPYAKIVIFSGSTPDDPEDEQWFARRTAGYVLKDQLDTLVDTLVAVASPPPEAAWSLTLPRDLASLAIARAYVRQQLHTWSLPGLVDSAVMIASELAGNAVEHAKSGFDLRLVIRSGRTLRVEVLDHGPGSPDLRPQDVGAERGRGLHLVSQFAEAWGVEPIEGNGKKVWAELSID